MTTKKARKAKFYKGQLEHDFFKIPTKLMAKKLTDEFDIWPNYRPLTAKERGREVKQEKRCSGPCCGYAREAGPRKGGKP